MDGMGGLCDELLLRILDLKPRTLSCFRYESIEIMLLHRFLSLSVPIAVIEGSVSLFLRSAPEGFKLTLALLHRFSLAFETCLPLSFSTVLLFQWLGLEVGAHTSYRGSVLIRWATSSFRMNLPSFASML